MLEEAAHVLSDRSWPGVTETSAMETADTGGPLYLEFTALMWYLLL